MLFKIGFALLAAGAVGIGIRAATSDPFDLTIARGWHVTVFAPGKVAAALSVLAGATVLAAAAFRARRSERIGQPASNR